jgi:hypothetical protein
LDTVDVLLTFENTDDPDGNPQVTPGEFCVLDAARFPEVGPDTFTV